MKAREASAGTGMVLRGGIPVPGTDLTFSFAQNMFVDNAAAPKQHIVAHAAALTGYRGTGKSLIVRELLATSVHESHGPGYAHRSTLVVVPDHLVKQWEDVLESPRGVTGDAIWEPSTPPEPIVLLSLSALMHAVHDEEQVYATPVEKRICTRNGRCPHTVTSVTWDRIVIDEICTARVIPVLLRALSWRFLWGLQGGTSTRDEMDLVEIMYSPPTLSGDILDHMVYNRLPVAVSIPTTLERIVCIPASRDEVHLRDAIGDMGGVWVYAQYAPDMFRTCDAWAGVLASEAMEVDPKPLHFRSPDDWLYPNELFHGANTVIINMNGVAISVALGVDEEESEFGGSEVEESEGTEVEEEFEISEDFVKSQLDTLAGGHVPRCVVCLDRLCNTIMCCGHTMCYICAVSITLRDEPSCPQCRMKLEGTHIWAVGDAFTQSAVVWLTDVIRAARTSGDKLFVLGSDDTGLERLRRDLPDADCVMHYTELNGKVETDVAHVILLDDAAFIPPTVSHHAHYLRVTKLRVQFPDAAL
jgi:hypothetical protein